MTRPVTTIARLVAKALEAHRQSLDDPQVRQGLIALMDGIRADEVSPGLPAVKPGGWQWEAICTTAECAVNLFTIAEGHAIPFHDHPSMWVLMRTLAGRLQVQAYDWVQGHAAGGVARLRYDVSMTADNETLVVEPDRGNIHRVVAQSDCVFVDIALPPYSDEEARPCRFYRIADDPLLDGHGLTKLVALGARFREPERDRPPDATLGARHQHDLARRIVRPSR